MDHSQINSRAIWKPVLIAASLLFLYFAVIIKLVENWWIDDNYSHGLLMPFVIGYIIWLEFDTYRETERLSRRGFGLATIFGALLLFVVGTLGSELYAQRISLVVMLAGIVIYFFGFKLLKKLAVPFGLLIFSIPIPQIIFNKIAFPLQMWASQIAAWSISAVGIPIVRKGNIIELIPVGQTQVAALEVVEACSGIRSLMALAALGLILGYFTRRTTSNGSGSTYKFLKDPDLWRTVIMMAAAVPIALITNAARVAVTGVLTYFYGIEAAEGWWHDASGWFVFISALALLVGLNFILQKLFRGFGPAGGAELHERPPSASPTAIPNFYVVGLFILLLASGVVMNWFSHRGEANVQTRPLAEVPKAIDGIIQIGPDTRFNAATEEVLGTTDYVMREYISVFDPKTAGLRFNLYIGYYASQRTGSTYHSPQNCLPGSGWEMKDGEYVTISTPAGRNFRANRYVVENGDYRALMIYWFQGRGRTEASEYWDKIYTIYDSVTKNRSDASMVRIMVPIQENEELANRSALEFSGKIADIIPEYVPE